MIFERRILRNIFGPTKELNGLWRIKTNEELDELIQRKNTGHFIMFCMITNIYNKKTKGHTLMELFTATGKLKKFFFDN
jgi:hypothetical protein